MRRFNLASGGVLLGHGMTGGNISRLSNREREVLALLSDHLSNDEIASSMTLSVHTVKTHVKHILAKLEVASRHQAADIWENRSMSDVQTE